MLNEWFRYVVPAAGAPVRYWDFGDGPNRAVAASGGLCEEFGAFLAQEVMQA